MNTTIEQTQEQTHCYSLQEVIEILQAHQPVKRLSIDYTDSSINPIVTVEYYQVNN